MDRSIPIAASDAGLVSALLAAELPIEDIGEPGRLFFRIERDDDVLGYCGYELYGEDALIRSIVVAPAQRGQGNGRAVTEALLREIANVGGKRAYLLTTTAAPFFEHLGFVATDRADAPASILATRQATSICSTAALLWREL